MNFKKYRKFIYILIVFVAFSVLFCNTFVSSALTSYNFVVSRPQITDNSCYFEVVNSSGAAYIYYVSVAVDGTGSNASNFDTEKTSIIFNTTLIDGSLWVYPSKIYTDSGTTSNGDTYEIYGTIITQDGSFTSASTSNITQNPNGKSSGLYVGTNYKCIRAYNANFVSSKGSDVVFVYGNEINTNDKLNKIYGAISDGNDEIMDNQDKNADKIKENQDKNTDKITNGWEEDEGFDKSASDNYSAKEKELLESSKESRENTLNFLRQGIDSVPIYGRCLRCATFIFNELSNIPVLQYLFRFSLTIGSFAFIFSIAAMVFRSLSLSDKPVSNTPRVSNTLRVYITNKHYNSYRKY